MGKKRSPQLPPAPYPILTLFLSLALCDPSCHKWRARDHRLTFGKFRTQYPRNPPKIASITKAATCIRRRSRYNNVALINNAMPLLSVRVSNSLFLRLSSSIQRRNIVLFLWSADSGDKFDRSAMMKAATLMSSGVSSFAYRFSSSCCDDKFRSSSSKFRFRDHQGFSTGVGAGENYYNSLGRRSPPISAPAGRLVMTQSSLSTGKCCYELQLYLDWSTYSALFQFKLVVL